MTDRRPSLLVFTRSPKSECARRRLLPARFSALARALLGRSFESALAAGRANGCRLEVASPRPLTELSDATVVGQRGGSFGERFRHAFEAARCRARGALVAIGSDVPGLDARHVREALERLGERRDRVVVGPSPDGGFYLLASHRPLDAELSRVRWCTRHALATLIAALEKSGLEVSLLEPLRDLDRPQDLGRWLARETGTLRGWGGLTAQLGKVLAELCRPVLPALVAAPVAGHGTPARGRSPPR